MPKQETKIYVIGIPNEFVFHVARSTNSFGILPLLTLAVRITAPLTSGLYERAG